MPRTEQLNEALKTVGGHVPSLNRNALDGEYYGRLYDVKYTDNDEELRHAIESAGFEIQNIRWIPKQRTDHDLSEKGKFEPHYMLYLKEK